MGRGWLVDPVFFTTPHNHHDTGYKELFSHPEFVEQLIGFAPARIAALMDFSTLQQHSGNYVTPLFEERFEDVVWSVEATWQGVTQRIYLYILLEFQSRVDQRMPLRMMHYVACFHDHLLRGCLQNACTRQYGVEIDLKMLIYSV